MKPMNDYNAVKAKSATITNTAQLPAGGYKCQIIRAEATDQQFILLFDIIDGEFANYFQNKFSAKKKFDSNAKYQGVFKQWLYEKGSNNTSPYFKGMITAIEDSNTGYHWDWNEKGLKDKLIGIVFRDEEYEINGNTGTSARPFFCCKASDAPAMPIPKKKALANKPVQPTVAVSEMTEAEDTELPF